MRRAVGSVCGVAATRYSESVAKTKSFWRCERPSTSASRGVEDRVVAYVRNRLMLLRFQRPSTENIHWQGNDVTSEAVVQAIAEQIAGSMYCKSYEANFMYQSVDSCLFSKEQHEACASWQRFLASMRMPQ